MSSHLPHGGPSEERGNVFLHRPDPSTERFLSSRTEIRKKNKYRNIVSSVRIHSCEHCEGGGVGRTRVLQVQVRFGVAESTFALVLLFVPDGKSLVFVALRC